MGTNYYIQKDPCPHCGREYEDMLHIGKSSAGWVFSLNTHPDLGIRSLEDWKEFWKDKNIVDEYGTACTEEYMLKVITERRWTDASNHTRLGTPGYKYAVVGPNNLLRHKLDELRHKLDDEVVVLAHGPGTWDILIGEFS